MSEKTIRDSLRLGNLVSLDGRPYCIVEIKQTQAYIIAEPSYNGEGFYVNYDVLSGLPLTREWLIKFGFQKRSGYYDGYSISADGETFYIEVSPNSFYWCLWQTEYDDTDWRGFKSLEFVHELQNIASTVYNLTILHKAE